MRLDRRFAPAAALVPVGNKFEHDADRAGRTRPHPGSGRSANGGRIGAATPPYRLAPNMSSTLSEYRSLFVQLLLAIGGIDSGLPFAVADFPLPEDLLQGRLPPGEKMVQHRPKVGMSPQQPVASRATGSSTARSDQADALSRWCKV